MFAAIGLALTLIGFFAALSAEDEYGKDSTQFKAWIVVFGFGLLSLLASACIWLWRVAP